MTSRILFILEGKKPDNSYARLLQEKMAENVVIQQYHTDIYALYSELKKDEYFDTVSMIAERDASFEYDESDFSQIYLFFDLDAQHDGYEAEALDKFRELLAFFDNETDKGKLLISYPMVEAFDYFSPNFLPNTSENKLQVFLYQHGDEKFKTKVTRFRKNNQSAGNLSLKVDYFVLINFALLDEEDIFNQIIDGTTMLERQIQEVASKKRVYIVSGYAQFIVGYFGSKYFDDILKKYDYQKMIVDVKETIEHTT